jgi:hypothetical protein
VRHSQVHKDGDIFLKSFNLNLLEFPTCQRTEKWLFLALGSSSACLLLLRCSLLWKELGAIGRQMPPFAVVHAGSTKLDGRDALDLLC